MNVYTILLITCCFAGCAKNTQPVDEPQYSDLYMKAFTADTLRLKVVADETELTNALYGPGDRLLIPAPVYYTPEHRIRIYNFYGNALLLDTMVAYRGTPFYMGFYQGVSGGKLQWVGPPVNEPLPADGYLKIAIVYTAPQLPASVKVVVENSLPKEEIVYAATDSFLLNKGAFSGYFTGRNHRDRKPRISLYTTGPERKLLATVATTQFRYTNFDFSTFLFDRGSGGPVLSLSSEKLY